MNPERIGGRVANLQENQGWASNKLPQSLEKSFVFATYSDAITFLIEVGSLAEATGALPTIVVENGNQVTLRLGQPDDAQVGEADVDFAEALAIAN